MVIYKLCFHNIYVIDNCKTQEVPALLDTIPDKLLEALPEPRFHLKTNSYIVNPALQTLVICTLFMLIFTFTECDNFRHYTLFKQWRGYNDILIIQVNATLNEPKVKSLKEAMVILEDVTEYLTRENLSETANDLSKVLSNIQST